MGLHENISYMVQDIVLKLKDANMDVELDLTFKIDFYNKRG